MELHRCHSSIGDCHTSWANIDRATDAGSACVRHPAYDLAGGHRSGWRAAGECNLQFGNGAGGGEIVATEANGVTSKAGDGCGGHGWWVRGLEGGMVGGRTRSHFLESPLLGRIYVYCPGRCVSKLFIAAGELPLRYAENFNREYFWQPLCI